MDGWTQCLQAFAWFVATTTTAVAAASTSTQLLHALHAPHGERRGVERLAFVASCAVQYSIVSPRVRTVPVRIRTLPPGPIVCNGPPRMVCSDPRPRLASDPRPIHSSIHPSQAGRPRRHAVAAKSDGNCVSRARALRCLGGFGWSGRLDRGAFEDGIWGGDAVVIIRYIQCTHCQNSEVSSR